MPSEANLVSLTYESAPIGLQSLRSEATLFQKESFVRNFNKESSTKSLHKKEHFVLNSF